MERKQKRRPEARPDEILDAATLVFVNQGFDAAPMDEIARQAGLSKGALYLYFKSKDALLEGIIDRFAKQQAARAYAQAERLILADPIDALRQVLRDAIAITSDAQQSLVPRLILSEAARFPAIAQVFRAQVIDQMTGTLKMVLTEGIRQGLFRQVQIDSAVRFIMGPLLAHALLTHVFNKPNEAALAPSAFANDVMDMIIDGLRAQS